MDPEVAVNRVNLTVGLSSVRQAVTAAIHAILFQRSLGAIQMVTEEIMGCPIAMLSDDLVAEAVNEKVETFYRSVRTRQAAADGSLGQIAVLFTQKRSKKTWFSSTEEQVPFEIHLITLFSYLGKTTSQTASTAEKASLSRAIMSISKFGVEHCSHIPGISSASSSFPFPYEIVLDPPNTSQPGLPTKLDLTSASSPVRAKLESALAAGPSAQDGSGDRRNREFATRPSSSRENRSNHISLSPARTASAPSSTATALGYLEQAKGGLMVVGEKMGGAVGAVGQWSRS